MELTNLLGVKPRHSTSPSQFLAIELTDDIIQAAVWKVEEGITEVVSLGVPVPWNGDQGNEEELLTATDSTVTAAVANLSEEPSAAIFGVPSAWLDNGNLLPDKKNYIKHICSSLELKPLGYVVIIDSVIRFLRMQEGTPSTAIIIEIADTELTLATVNLGKIHKTCTVPRSDDVSLDVETALSHCTQGMPNLPSRFIIFNGMHDLEEIVQNLTLVDWVSKYSFLHIPKVEALDKDVVIRALCVAGGSEVARSIGYDIKPLDDVPLQVPTQAQAQDDSPISSLGFQTTEDPEELDSDEEEEDLEDTPSSNSHPKLLPKINLPSLGNFSLPKFNFFPSSVPKWSIIVAGLIFVVLAFFLGAMWLFPKATITVLVAPHQEEALFDLKLSEEQTEPDFTSLTLPAKLQTIEVSGKGEVPTTGTRLIGDPSRGEVTLYNRTSLKKTFTKGTVVAAGNIKFTLDSDVVVASKSAGADYVDVPGKATVAVTAQSIGDTGNLKSGTEFVIGTYTKDSYIGKNDAPFKGGTSEEVAAVDAKDKAELVKTIRDKMIEDAKNQVDSSDFYTHAIPSSFKIIKETYSSKVGAEAKSLEGEIQGEIDVYVFEKSKVVDFATKILEERLVAGSYTMVETPSIELVGKDDMAVNIKAIVQALPSLPEASSIKEQVKGVGDSKLIEKVVSSIPGYRGVKVLITPSWIPPKLKSLPRNTDNITLKLQPVN